MNAADPYTRLILPRNAPILQYPPHHPARRFLLAQARFRAEVIGFEITYSPDQIAIPDLEWYSVSTGKAWKLSSVFYKCFSYTLMLDDWLENLSHRSTRELRCLEEIHECRTLLREAEGCLDPSTHPECSRFIKSAKELTDLWGQSILARTS